MPPTDLAVQGHERASEIAPFDDGLLLALGSHYASAGKVDMAKAHLIPIAFAPHGGELADIARQMLRDIDAPGKAGQAPQSAPPETGPPASAPATTQN